MRNTPLWFTELNNIGQFESEVNKNGNETVSLVHCNEHR